MKRFLCFCLISTVLASSIMSQSWLFTSVPSNSTGVGYFLQIKTLPNGDFAMAGYGNFPGSPQDYGVPYLVRVNPHGQLIWDREYSYLNSTDAQGNFLHTDVQRMAIGPDGSMYILRNSYNTNEVGFLARVNPAGDTLWVNPLQNYQESIFDLVAMPDGGLIYQYFTYETLLGIQDQLLVQVRLDSNGQLVNSSAYQTDQLWPSNPLPAFHSLDWNGGTLASADQGIIFYGQSQVTQQPALAKFTPNGARVYHKTFQNLVPSQSGEVRIRNISATPDSSLVILLKAADSTGNQARLVWFSVNADGDSIATQLTDEYIDPLSFNGGMALSPIGDRYVLFPSIQGQDSIMKWDDQGQLLWKKEIDLPTGEWYFDQIEWTPDQRLLLAGSSLIGQGTIPLALRLDTAGALELNLITGKVFADPSQDCLQQSGEPSLSQWLIKVDPGPFYTFTDASGQFEALVDSNQHWVSAIPPASVWSSIWSPVCPSNPDSNLVDFTGVPSPDTASGVDFAFRSLIDCPLLQVDLSAPFIRRCTTSTYYVNYCNFGSQTAPTAFVEVSLDSSLTFLTATLPFTPLPQPNTYRFDLDSIPVGQCGSFQITVDVLCDTLNPGRIHCATAHIFPDSICDPPSSAWSNASLEVEGTCLPNDNVRFRVRNRGNGNMQAATGIWVVEDDILRQQTTLSLPAGQDTFFTYTGDGSTWALLADQVPFHPGQSYPRAVIEGCGTNPQGLISTGFASQFGEDDLNPWISTDCQEDIGSWDPNDKTGFPTGVGSNHEILATDEMEYLIRFQNTGTDTAFKVVIKDEIPPTLDLGTFVMGAASHPYQVRIQNGNTLEWTFDPIALPDSSVDQAGSQGFVKFYLRQQANNPPGTRITNAANIFFDFNVPVLTDSAIHTIQERLETLVTLDEPLQPAPTPAISIYPNPFTESVTFELTNYQPQKLRLEVFDLNGRLVRQVELGRNQKFDWESQGLPPGTYPFRLSDREQILRNGKLIIARP